MITIINFYSEGATMWCKKCLSLFVFLFWSQSYAADGSSNFELWPLIQSPVNIQKIQSGDKQLLRISGKVATPEGECTLRDSTVPLRSGLIDFAYLENPSCQEDDHCLRELFICSDYQVEIEVTSRTALHMAAKKGSRGLKTSTRVSIKVISIVQDDLVQEYTQSF